jgi:hypothetical protein
MRVVVRILVGYVLAVLLAGTSPVGTGQGVHANQLLDAVVPHVHLVNGQIVQPGRAPQPPAVDIQPASGPALGAGSGAAAASTALVLTPPVPASALRLVGGSDRYLYLVGRGELPRAQVIAPPDPPPNARA